MRAIAKPRTVTASRVSPPTAKPTTISSRHPVAMSAAYGVPGRGVTCWSVSAAARPRHSETARMSQRSLLQTTPLLDHDLKLILIDDSAGMSGSEESHLIALVP